MRSIVGNINSRSLNKLIKETFERIKMVPYVDYQMGPEKRFEIYCINNDDSKLVIGYINEFQTEQSTKSVSALFYNKENALEIYNLLETLNNNTYNSFPELMEMSQNEIGQLQYEIDLLKSKDEEEYKKDLNLYNQFKQSYLYLNTQQAYKAILDSNNRLQEKYNNLNKNQAKTLNKMSFILQKYEELDNKFRAQKENVSLVKKIFNKVLNKK